MPKKNPFIITEYCAKYKRIYPYNIAECLNMEYPQAEHYFYKFRRLYPNDPDGHNNINSVLFFEWYLNDSKLDL